MKHLASPVAAVPASPGDGLRTVGGGLLLAVFAATLLWPPGPGREEVNAAAGFWVRTFPIVPVWWITGRLAALAAGAWLLSRPLTPRPGWRGCGPAPIAAEAEVGPGGAAPRDAERVAGPALRRRQLAALATASVLALASPWSSRLPPPVQSLVLVALFLPCALLAAPRSATRVRRRLERAARGRETWAAGAVIVAWICLTVVSDVGSPRGADVVDGWRAWIDLLLFVERGKSILADLIDPELPGLGSTMLFFHGLPFFQAGLLHTRVPTAALFQTAWLAAAATGFALLVGRVVDGRAAALGVAVLLFSPYTRFCAALPGPFALGHLYGTGLLLAAFAACRHRSDAGLAALGTLSGLALLFPGVVPVAGTLVLLTLWQLRRELLARWVGLAAGLGGFLGAVVPQTENLLALGRMTQHLKLHGALALLEPSLLGQLPVGAAETARGLIVWRPLDVVAGALLAPFAHPRLAMRLWGDSLLDPLGAALVAVGLLACLRSLRDSPRARFLLLLYGVTILPAFVSPVDRVDIVHAVVFPIAAALLAATGFDVVRRQLPERAPWRVALGLAPVAAALGGTWLFDVVNPRILSASAPGIVFRALQPEASARAILLDYPAGHSVDVRWLLVGPMTAFAGPRPIGYLPFPGGALPADDLAANGKDLLFWSPGLDEDLRVRDAVCAAWPGAALLELRDRSGLARTYAARTGAIAWQPGLPHDQWRETPCTAPRAPVADRGDSARDP